MSRETAKLLKRLESEKDSAVIRRLRALLEMPNARVEPSSGLTALASDLEPIYRVRNQTAMERKITKCFLGLSQLVSSLQASRPSRMIAIQGVIGDLELGEIFFDADTNEMVGAVVITMSSHTRAYYRGELINDPTGATQGLRKPSKPTPRRVVKQNKVMA